MISEKIYHRILTEFSESGYSLRSVTIEGVDTAPERRGVNHELLEVLHELVNWHINIHENDQTRSIPLFRHVELRENDAKAMDLHVVMNEDAALTLA